MSDEDVMEPPSLDALLLALDEVLSVLGEDEIKVILCIAQRMKHGERVYGRLCLATDKRNFRREAREEIEDFLAYMACAWLTAPAKETVSESRPSEASL